jgi:hypothetical protein
MVIHAGLLVVNLRRNFLTVDEFGHIPAGLHNWQTGSYFMYRVNPPTVRMLATLPLLMVGAELPGGFDHDSPSFRQEFVLGDAFARANDPRQYFDLVCLARLAGVAWSMLGLWIIFRWASEVYGNGAGVVGAAVWCFGPNVLGHAPLVTNDVPAAVAGLVATYAFWHYLLAPNWGRAVGCGLLLGLAQLTKFTLLALYPIWLVLVALSWATRRRRVAAHFPAARQAVLHATVIVAVSFLVINCGYEFSGTGTPLAEVPFVSHTFAGQPRRPLPAHALDPGVGNRFQDNWLGSLPLPVPADYVRGIDVQRYDFERFGFVVGSYLRGEWREEGWWYYYCYALLVKVPVGTWALALAALGMTVLRFPRPVPLLEDCFLWVPGLAFLVLVSSQTGFNHHMRYVFPALPFLAVAVSRVGVGLNRGTPRASATAVVCLLACTAASSLRVWPHSLSYFNELAGGPENGHAHLLDSNIDWGQDLLELRDWQARHPEARPLGLRHFGYYDPSLLGIDYVQIPREQELGTSFRTTADWQQFGPQPGYFALSVNYLCGRGMMSIPPSERGKATHGLGYFRLFTPIGQAGFSIYIYHVTRSEANAVREQLGLPPLLDPKQGEWKDRGPAGAIRGRPPRTPRRLPHRARR